MTTESMLYGAYNRLVKSAPDWVELDGSFVQRGGEWRIVCKCKKCGSTFESDLDNFEYYQGLHMKNHSQTEMNERSVMKFSKRGYLNFYDHFHYMDGTIEDFEFEPNDVEGGIVIGIEEAKLLRKLASDAHYSSVSKGDFDDADTYLKLKDYLKKSIEIAEREE